MKVVCINNRERHTYLTYGKIYEGHPHPSTQGYGKKNYRVWCDDGRLRWELKWRFITLEEWRDLKLKDLGI